MLRLPLAIINIVVAGWLVLAFVRQGIRPALALVAVLPFAATAPATSSHLMETLGASVEPFLYVLALWALRNRPIAFGALFAVAFLHRELTIFVLPALLIARVAEGRPIDRGSAIAAARSVAGFAVVWIAVDVLKRHINALGPSGGAVEYGPLSLQAQMLIGRLSVDVPSYVARLRELSTGTLLDLFGARPGPPLRYGTVMDGDAGSRVAGALLLAALGVAAWKRGRAYFPDAGQAPPRRRESPTDARGSGEQKRGRAFFLYLALVGAQAILAYGLNGGIVPTAVGTLRYVLFALLIPVALLGAFFATRQPRWTTATVASLVVLYASFNVIDTARLAAQYRTVGPSEHAMLADYLVAHGIKYGRAGYWDAYVVDFLAKEQVILTPTDNVRIGSYEALVRQNAGSAVDIRRQPCSGGAAFASWCIERASR